ncbi:MULTISPECIES: HAMP domain-containing sensor histidine kinase [unclassified Paenibacillus]|uniref:sensor histidine kinase n=1 Tax=unclassified Paenibacillus TaxID=185978 RepID=UPI000954B7F7|nr:MULTISPECIES: HAMP domain-containing sensor histidine kinase [unclassified Paenibacillus]ASS67885.1 HAMP domain-containing histidine kinase [Paenibacillus sp. RUD330]SIR44964.1 Signal transduction histidine kinase [Paenibacillus sp. RU4X]SIR54598.1 Signal transduction histidine kinase [Paenibacillus sp. RU4T]
MNKPIRLGLKGKVAILLALLLASVLAVLSFLVLTGIKEDQRRRLEQSFAQQTEMASLKVQQEYLTGQKIPVNAFMERSGQRLAVDLGADAGMAVTLYQADGGFAGSSLPAESKWDAEDALTYTAKGQAAYITQGDRVLYLAPLYLDGTRAGTIQFHSSLAEQHAFYDHIQSLFLGTGALVLIAGFLIGYGYVWRQVNVISKLNIAAQQIGRGHYLASPLVRRSDELGQLSDGIYEMSSSISSSVAQLTEEKLKLLEAIARLQELEQQQKQFIGNISHELKTPLTSIRAYTELLHMYQDDPLLLEEARTHIGIESERLYALIEKAIQLSAMDIYDFETRAESVPISAFMEEAVNRLQVKAQLSDVALEVRAAAGYAWADPENIMHMIVNLVDNAVKYNKPGGTVTVSNYVEKDDSGQSGWMVIEVADTGKGIPAESADRIFDPFYTVSGDRSRAYGGTGLGLSLVRSLAEKQRGSVHLIESGPEGSRFVLRLPLQDSAVEGS